LSSTIIEFDKLSGEATANNRKGKLIFFYEWDLVLKWQGIPNLSEENDLDEIDITITVDESNDKSEILKQFMYNIGRVKIREQVGKYITSLKNDYAKNLILPKKDDAQVRFKKTSFNSLA
jgi:activator of HSP90 ATPase